MLKRWIWLTVVWLFAISSGAQALVLDDSVQQVLPRASIYTESARPLEQADLFNSSAVEFFRPLQSDTIRTGVDASPFWINLVITSEGSEAAQRVMFIDSPYIYIDEVVDIRQQMLIKKGDRSLSMVIPPGPHELYIRLVPRAPTSVSITIAQPELALAARLQAGGVQAIMAGVLLSMSAFALWYALRQRNWLLFFMSVYFSLGLFFFGAVWPYAVATVTPSTQTVAWAFVLNFLLIFWLIASYMVRSSLPDWFYRILQTLALTLLILTPFLLWMNMPQALYAILTVVLCPIVLGTCIYGYRGQAPGLSAIVASSLAFCVWLVLWWFEMRGESITKPLTIPVFCGLTMLHSILLYHGVFSYSRNGRGRSPLPVTKSQSVPVTTKLLKDISHSLNNRINGLTGTMDMLSQTGIASQHKEWFGTIDLSVLQLESLCDELNTITLLQDKGAGDSKQRLLSHQNFNVNEMMKSVVEPFQQVAARLGVELIVDLVPVTHGARVGPGEAIKRALKIILGRAIDSSAPGDEIILTAIATNDRDCRFRVQARGMQMSPSDIQSLLHNNHEHPKALGLPLALHLAKQFHAEILVSSDNPGVSFVLPVQLPIQFDEQRESTVRDTWQLPTGMRVLVVDDSLTCRRTLQPMLQQLQMRVEVADNIQSALATIETQYHIDDPFELILCDHQLGNYSGMQLVREINEGKEPWQKRLLVVLMSGTPKFELPDEYRQLGVKHVVEKPVFMSSLRHTLEKAYSDHLRGAE